MRRTTRRTTLAILGASALTLALGATAVTANAGTAATDADTAALEFTTDYLGFTEIDQVKSHDVGETEAWVTVGYDEGVSATLHLTRPDADADWKVVGTKDDGFSITSPADGDPISSPLEVEGRISGVDESIVVDVRQPSSEEPLGTVGGIPAGGEDSPWSATVEFSGATDPELHVVASTGGHIQTVERFTVRTVTAG